ncbi:hypothetical protein Bbelb_398550 [Branchiostoma belcheri]|nr:hypothetical protein Bbelb_398550 [Branchiostoma belcheri]
MHFKVSGYNWETESKFPWGHVVHRAAELAWKQSGFQATSQLPGYKRVEKHLSPGTLLPRIIISLMVVHPGRNAPEVRLRRGRELALNQVFSTCSQAAPLIGVPPFLGLAQPAAFHAISIRKNEMMEGSASRHDHCLRRGVVEGLFFGGPKRPAES